MTIDHFEHITMIVCDTEGDLCTAILLFDPFWTTSNVTWNP